MRRTAVVAISMVMLALVTPVDRASADDRLGLSRDARTWASDLRGGLFDDEIAWVPGDRRTAAFYVRNQAADPAELVIAIRKTGVDDLIATGDLQVTARSDRGTWTQVANPGTQELLRVPVLTPGAIERVALTVELRPTATNQSQGRSLDLAFDVRLEQRITSGSEEPDGLLPGTGGPVWWLASVAVVSIGLGTALVRFRRRSDPA